jgi:transposase
MEVTHFTLHKGECGACGKTVRGCVPDEFRTGSGARFSAPAGEIGGMEGGGRETVRRFISSVLGVHISTGAVQKIIDRVSAAFSLSTPFRWSPC